jgi:transposase InsO family protein
VFVDFARDAAAGVLLPIRPHVELHLCLASSPDPPRPDHVDKLALSDAAFGVAVVLFSGGEGGVTQDGGLRPGHARAPENRYEHERPGDLVHVDTKKLGRIDGVGHRITGDRTRQSSKRGTGWEVLHVAIDDASRLAYTEVLPDEKKETTCAFTSRALAWFSRHGAPASRLMSDNGSAYKSHAIRRMLAEHGPW